MRNTLTGLCLAVLVSLGCSGDGTLPSEPAPDPLPLELLPLAQGSVWKYYFYMNEKSTRALPDGEQLTLTISYGMMELSVPREVSGGFSRSYQLNSNIRVDSVRTEKYMDLVLQSRNLDSTVNTYPRNYTIFFERDTLWYLEGGILDYMMPGRFSPGGSVNLKIFNFPGTDYFLQPLPYSARWGSGDMIYLKQSQIRQASVKIGGFEGVLGVWAASRESTGGGNTLERELRYVLTEGPVPQLAPSTSTN